MPDAGDLRYFLLLDKNRFYALSWMISELGNLKDSGLRREGIKEALNQSGSTDEKAALTKARSFLGNRQLTEQQVLDQAEAILKVYCKEQNLEALITDTASVKK